VQQIALSLVLPKKIMKKEYYYIGARNAWDNVPIGLFESVEEAERNNSYPGGKILPATPEMVEKFLEKKREDSQTPLEKHFSSLKTIMKQSEYIVIYTYGGIGYLQPLSLTTEEKEQADAILNTIIDLIIKSHFDNYQVTIYRSHLGIDCITKVNEFTV